jgi:hypothetical protein
MSTNSKLLIKAASIALMVAGIGLLVWGYQMTGSPASEISRTITGSYPDGVMERYIGGAAAFIVGLYLFAKG